MGKSTLIRHLFPEYSYVLFDPYEDVEGARADPDLFLSNHSLPLILDEVQYAPEVISAVKRRIDRNKTPGQYILTGSQQWGVMKQMAESMTGRAVITELEPFSLGEIARLPHSTSWVHRWLDNPEKFLKDQIKTLTLPKQPYEQIWRGFLPEAQVIPLELMSAFHQSYQKTYIERDIRLLADISDLHQFTRFVRLMAALTAQEVNFQQLGRDLGIAGDTAKRWVTLLKEIFEWHEIPAFSMNSIKRISKKPKGYFSDTGQACFCQAISTSQALGAHPLWGALFETAVINEVRKQISSVGISCNLYHWRSHAGAEVDLIIEQNGVHYPLKVKAGTRPSKSDTRGLKAFRQTYPSLKIAPGLIVCLADSSYLINPQDLALPWHACL